ncbi:MAG: ankyrin repeat domain-containing protein [Verrucomicrobiota bacterium]
MRKYRLILLDTLILCLVSTVLAIAVDFAVTKLKGEVKKDDPIVIAIIQANTKVVENLVIQGAGVTNETDELGRTALMRAAFANFSEPRGGLEQSPAGFLSDTDGKRAGIVGLLLSHGAMPDSRDHDGWTALMWASWSGLTQVVGKLLEGGASPQFADHQGNTALLIAAQRGNAAIVSALLAKGADAAVANKAGSTALAAARTGLAQYPEQALGYAAVIAQLSPAK